MKVVNRTHWNTKHLRDICARVVQTELKTSEQRKRLIITIKYGRASSWVSGYCMYGVLRPVIMVWSREVDKVDFAHTVAHELCHAKGWHHRDFTGQARYTRVGNWRELYAWAEAMPLERQVPKRKTRPTTDTKIDHVRKMIARWTAKQKRATTGVKAWTRRLKYYERKKAAMGIDTQVEF